MTTYLRYYDPRFGDVYDIYLNADGSFHSARRSVERIGADPIYYDTVEEIPPAHRTHIEDLITRAKGN